MGRRFPPKEAELYRRCDEVLHYIWDPIGVAGAPGARDEYYAYLPLVYALVRDESSVDQIIMRLAEFENYMGLTHNPQHDKRIAEILLNWREWIWEFTD